MGDNDAEKNKKKRKFKKITEKLTSIENRYRKFRNLMMT
ncbi:Protein CBG11893 [Caenorhabditis briggsae]|uniref:Protein CBG11893 n=1 Tax=Caenorhabditis briggsae TaxID=6238 RepID=A8XE90_CAEBR|nr:Protein CBG11893 [Caenorhabditis briggsae]CAP30962.2 Protein CBG11893 [Caenorhabditis briggsae]